MSSTETFRPAASAQPCAQAGFTLLEVICSLILLGVMASLTFGFLNKAFTGYAETRINSRGIAQEELGLLRLQRALYSLYTVSFANSGALTFTNSRGQDYAIALNKEKQVTLNASPLIENIAGLTLSYTAEDGTAWTSTDDPASLVLISLTLHLTDPGERSLTLTVCPRSNSNTGLSADL